MEYCAESGEQNGCLGAEWLSISAVSPRDGGVGGSSGCPAQHHESESYLLSLAQEKMQIQNSKYDSY